MTTIRSHPNPSLVGWGFEDGVQGPSLHYRLMRKLLQVTVSAFWKVRVFNRHLEPTRGGVVYICNHQSFLDPILMSFALCRPMNYMARDSLFRVPVLGAAIWSVNAFPVRRGTADTTAIKEAMRRVKKGGQVVLFAEGTRTRDGRIGEFLPGVALLARRVAEWTVPVLIDGAFEAWPRTQKLPSTGNVVVQYGAPLHREQVRKMKPRELIAEVRSRIIEIQTDVRKRAGRPDLDYSS